MRQGRSRGVAAAVSGRGEAGGGDFKKDGESIAELLGERRQRGEEALGDSGGEETPRQTSAIP